MESVLSHYYLLVSIGYPIFWSGIGERPATFYIISRREIILLP